MTAYATTAEFESYVEGWVTDDEDALERLLDRASEDIDSIVGPYPIIESGDYAGRKLDPTTLVYSQGRALERATCAQAEYRFEMGEAFFTRPQYDSSSGPEFSASSVLSHVGPKVYREFAGSGLLRNQTSIANRRRGHPGWLDFALNLDYD